MAHAVRTHMSDTAPFFENGFSPEKAAQDYLKTESGKSLLDEVALFRLAAGAVIEKQTMAHANGQKLSGFQFDMLVPALERAVAIEVQRIKTERAAAVVEN